jgi:hypothetical protein
MKFAVDSNHRDYFHKNQAIEFDALLTEKQVKLLASHIKLALSARLNSNNSISPENNFLAGRDLFRLDPIIRKIVIQKHLAEIASELIDQKPLRLGYDQFIPFPPTQQILDHHQSPYCHLLNSTPTLQEMSSLQGVLCGLLICIEAKVKFDDHPEEERTFFSRKAGNGVFYHPNAKLNFADLVKSPGCSYLLVVYVHSTTVYILNTLDPNTYLLKNYGYSLGDKLTDKLNPIIIR